jgi:hypothetical protein
VTWLPAREPGAGLTAGHDVTVATHPPFEESIRGAGLGFAALGGDVQVLVAAPPDGHRPSPKDCGYRRWGVLANWRVPTDPGQLGPVAGQAGLVSTRAARICSPSATPRTSGCSPRTAAVVQHGGAGTTAAGLRAGRPSVLPPSYADQPLWTARVHALGAGRHHSPAAADRRRAGRGHPRRGRQRALSRRRRLPVQAHRHRRRHHARPESPGLRSPSLTLRSTVDHL